MTDLWLPDVRIASASPRLMDNTGRFTSPLTGTVRTIARPGDRWGVRLDYQNLFGLDRARVEAFIARMRGAANRVLWSPALDFPQRGSFPSAEKFINNNFANGVTGWTAGAGGSITVTDRRLRFTMNGAGTAQLTQSVANMTPYMPHVVRYFFVDGKGTPLALGAFDSYIEGTVMANFAQSIEGLNVVPGVPDTAGGNQFPLYPVVGAGPLIPTNQIAGNYLEMVWTSLSQCMLVDNGPNLLQYSDTLASPWTASAATVTVNVATAADNTVTGAAINDTTANAVHQVAQSVTLNAATNIDYMICGEFKLGAVNFVYLNLVENTGPSAAAAWFNLNTGVVSLATLGTNWARSRTFIRPLGNGWYYCALVASKTNAAAAGAAQVGPSNASGVTTYTGTGAAAIYSRRITMAQSSVPNRQIQSAGASVAAAAQTGSSMYVKGLPPSTSGLLLPGDWVQLTNLASGTLELKRVTGQLDSDAAGLGFLQFSPPIRTSPNDNDPVIVNMPMGRFILSANQNGWQSIPGPNAQPFHTSALDLIEASA